MKLAIVLSHADILSAVTAFVMDQQDAAITSIDFSVNGDGEVTAVAHTADTDAKEAPAKTGRSARGSASAAATAEVEDKPATASRSRRGSATKAEEPETTAPATRSRRGSKPAEPVKPTVSEKTDEEYDVDPSETADDNTTYWQNNEDAAEVFAVPAGQLLPDAEFYTELESEEAALEALQGDAKEEVVPEQKTRSRRGATKTEAVADEAEEAAPAGRTRRGAAKEETVADAPATTGRTRRGASAAATEEAEEAAPATGRRRLFNRK